MIQQIDFCNIILLNKGSEISKEEADIFVTGKDLAPQMREYPRVIVLTKLISLKELTEKLRTAFAQESDTFFIE